MHAHWQLNLYISLFFATVPTMPLRKNKTLPIFISYEFGLLVEGSDYLVRHVGYYRRADPLTRVYSCIQPHSHILAVAI